MSHNTLNEGTSLPGVSRRGFLQRTAAAAVAAEAGSVALAQAQDQSAKDSKGR